MLVVAEQLGDLAGGQALLAPGSDLVADLTGPVFWQLYPREWARAGRGCRTEEVTQEANVARLVAEAVSHGRGGETLDQGSAKGLVATLPFGFGVGKEGCVPHRDLLLSVTVIIVNYL